MKKGRDARFSYKRCGNAGTRIRNLHFFYSTPRLPPKFCITFVFYFSWVLHSSQEKLNFCSKNAAALMKFFYCKMRLLFEGSVYFSESWTQNKNCFKYGIITVKPPLQTPHYHGQFALSLGKESPYICLLYTSDAADE